MSAIELNVEGPWNHDDFTIACTREPQPDLVADFWQLYEEAFGPLRKLAAARQVLTRDEFTAELVDPRVWKYVARDRNHELAGLTTLSNDLSTMTWISPEYYAHHYPEEWNRNAVFYTGLSLVRPDMQRFHVFASMVGSLGERVAAVQGVVAFDVCGYNDGRRSLPRVSGRSLNRVAAFEVRAVDVQTYYVGKATGSEGKRS